VRFTNDKELTLVMKGDEEEYVDENERISALF
jgi:hypothetical protein